MNNKFELVMDQKIEFFGRTLFRIKALVSFANVEVGEIGGYVEKEENLQVSGNAWVYGDARVYGDALVYGDAWVYGNAQVYGNAHYLTMDPIGSRNDTITFFRTKELKIAVSIGCFRGYIDEFALQVKETHEENAHAKAYLLAAEIAKLRIDLTPDKATNPSHDPE